MSGCGGCRTEEEGPAKQGGVSFWSGKTCWHGDGPDGGCSEATAPYILNGCFPWFGECYLNKAVIF